MSTTLRCVLCVVVLVLCAGCGGGLSVEYGVHGQDRFDARSINGVEVLYARLGKIARLRQSWQLGEHLHQDCALIVHLARHHGLPDEDACAFLRAWLDKAPGRQAVLILRDGNLAPFLGTRWANEARAAAASAASSSERERLLNVARQLDSAAERGEAADTRWFDALHRSRRTSTGAHLDAYQCSLFRVTPAARRPVERLLGSQDAELPTPLAASIGQEIRSEPTFADGEWSVRGTVLYRMVPAATAAAASTRAELLSLEAPLFASEPDAKDGALEPTPGTGRAYAVTFPFANGASRLMVLANATPLLDGALPDAAARALCAGVLDHIGAFHTGRPDAVWLQSLHVRREDPDEDHNLTSLLLHSFPLNVFFLHVFALLLCWILARALWLGRREAAPDRSADRFTRHVLALAGHLRDAHGAAHCAGAIARAWGRSAPDASACRDAHAARQALAVPMADATASAAPASSASASPASAAPPSTPSTP